MQIQSAEMGSLYVRDEDIDKPKHVVLICAVERRVKAREVFRNYGASKGLFWPPPIKKNTDEETLNKWGKFIRGVVYKYDEQQIVLCKRNVGVSG